MSMMQNLQTSLLDLLYETRESDLQLIIGGGYGIYLRSEHVRRSGSRTLLSTWPEARSTNDIDLFLRPELLIESKRLKPLAIALRQLGYEAIPGAEKYQFAKPGPYGGTDGGFKIDLLTGPKSRFTGTTAKVDDRRVRPKPSVGLHAHHVDEALTLEDQLLRLTIQGKTSEGSNYQGDIYLPHPLTFVMMKLFAFRDRLNDPSKDNGSYHALDLYSVMAMTSEQEWEQALIMRKTHQSQQLMFEASQIVVQYFSSSERLGMLRLRESPYYRPGFQLDEFSQAMRELFSD